MERCKTERLQVILGPSALTAIDDYHLVAARLDSKSEVIRRLLAFALQRELPTLHLDTINKIKETLEIRPPGLSKKTHEKAERLHVALDVFELGSLDDYRFAMHYGSRTETIRSLLAYALEGRSPSVQHIDVIKHVVEPRNQIRKRAHAIWKAEGRLPGKSEEYWRRAEAEIVDFYREAKSLSRSELLSSPSVKILEEAPKPR